MPQSALPGIICALVAASLAPSACAFLASPVSISMPLAGRSAVLAPLVKPALSGISMQLFPLEGMGLSFKWPGGQKGASAGGGKLSGEAKYHQSREQYHLDRIKYHQERAKHHRDQTARIMGGSDRTMSPERGMKRIVFVDLSNTCRSAAAEGMLKQAMQKQGQGDGYTIASRSTGGGMAEWYKPEVARYIEQESTDPRMTSHAIKRGVSLSGIRSQPISREDIESFDLIICMDQQNQRDVMQAADYWGVKSEAKSKLRSLTSFCRGTTASEVPDPYYGGQGGASGQVFEKVLDLLEDGCEGLASDLQQGIA